MTWRKHGNIGTEMTMSEQGISTGWYSMSLLGDVGNGVEVTKGRAGGGDPDHRGTGDEIFLFGCQRPIKSGHLARAVASLSQSFQVFHNFIAITAVLVLCSSCLSLPWVRLYIDSCH